MILHTMWFDDSPEYDMTYEMWSPTCTAIGVRCGSYWRDDSLNNAIIYVGY